MSVPVGVFIEGVLAVAGAEVERAVLMNKLNLGCYVETRTYPIDSSRTYSFELSTYMYPLYAGKNSGRFFLRMFRYV